MKNRNITLTTVILLLDCFGLLPGARATDLGGVLPGGNNADGYRVLTNLTTGGFNTGSGWFSLFSDQAGSFNTAFGAATLFSNTGDGNTAVGTAALFSNTTGTGNTATGLQALFSNTDGIRNAANGVYALNHNVSGGGNTAVGYQALATSTADSNTAVGNDALVGDTTGGNNTAVGAGALLNNAVGGFNAALGAGALSNSLGLGNIGIGALAGGNIMGASNVIAIGHQGANVSNTTWINNVYGIATISGVTVPVIVSDAGQLGTNSSSERFKKDIATMAKASEAILLLRPVTFHYKSDTKDVPQFGLIAEEVAKVNPDLVVRDKEGKPYTVRYDAVNAMLLNEFLKEHRKNEQQEATIAKLNKQIASLTTTVKEQAAQIQKVIAQLETSEGVRQVASRD
jgi:uncharacterized coiled-coil protein SlyX